MTLQEYGKFVASNGEAMRALGVTTAAGAKRFAVLSQALQSTSSELYGLGFTTGDINNGLASYAKLMQMSNNIRKKSDADLITGTKAYLKELDLVAKATGMTREQAADKMAEMNIDPQFSAFMDSLGPMGDDIRTTILANLNTLGPAAGKLLKDYLSTGGIPTTEEHAAISTAFGGTMAEANRINQMAIGGQLKTAEQADTAMKRLIDMLKLESSATTAQGGLANLNRFGDVGITLIQSMGNEIKKSQEAARQQAEYDQNVEVQARDKSIKNFIALQKSITEVGNSFTLVLSESGMLGVLKTSFESLSSGIEMVGIPLFKAFGSVMKSATDQITEWLKPFAESFKELTTYIPSILSTAFSPLGDYLKTKFGGIFDQFKNPDGKGGFDVKSVATSITETLGSMINILVSYIRKAGVLFDELSAKLQLSGYTFDDLKLHMLQFMSVVTRVMSALTFGFFGTDELRDQYANELDAYNKELDSHTDERKTKEEELHKVLSKTTERYQKIDDDLAEMQNKLHDRLSGLSPTSTTPAAHVEAAKAIAEQVAATTQEVANKSPGATTFLPKGKGVGKFSSPAEEAALEPKAKQVMDMLLTKGWTPNAAAGIAANLFRESRFKTTADSGTYKGLGQWSPQRQGDFEAKFHKKITDATLKESVDFLDWEYNTNATYKKVKNQMMQSKSAQEAAWIHEKGFEVTKASIEGNYDLPQLTRAERYAAMLSGGKPTTAGLPVKAGASTGGSVLEGTVTMAKQIHDAMGGLFNRVTAFNDKYHHDKNPTSEHTKGRAVDFTLTDPSQSKYAEQVVKEKMAELGIKDYTLLNEYLHPSKHATAGHIHVGLKSKLDAEKWANSYKSRQEEDRIKKEQQEVANEEKETQRVQQEEMQKQNAQNVQSSTDTHSQLLEQLLASFSELKQINADQLSAHERHISIAQAQSGNMYAG
jgi:hypothetical protein